MRSRLAGIGCEVKYGSARYSRVRLSPNGNEQTGFRLLYQGAMQAIRNHYAHNLTEAPVARALECLGFISALFYKLDESTVTPPAQ